MKLTSFDTPAGVNDGVAGLPSAWTAQLSTYFNSEVAGVEHDIGAGKSQFYNPMVVETPTAHSELPIAWTAFPGVAKNIFGADALGALKGVDEPVRCRGPRGTVVFRPQDEYCEWRVERAANGKISRITFTCEGPDYWQVLARTDQQALLRLYRQFVGPNVQLADLIVNGKYNVANKWNTTDGIVHLTHPANTLGAEVDIAARATVLRKRSNGQLITDSNELICCAQYGEPLRASDPSIGHSINVLAQQGMMITLKNPVGLYIRGLDTTGWQTPDNSDPQQYWKVVRGNAAQNMILRAVYEVPAAAGFTVSDIKIGGQPIDFGGQVAQQITVGLTGVAFRPTPPVNTAAIPRLGCLAGTQPGCPGGGKIPNLCAVTGMQPAPGAPAPAHAAAAAAAAEEVMPEFTPVRNVRL